MRDERKRQGESTVQRKKGESKCSFPFIFNDVECTSVTRGGEEEGRRKREEEEEEKERDWKMHYCS